MVDGEVGWRHLGEITSGTIVAGNLADNAVTDAKVADDITLTTTRDVSVAADKKVNFDGASGTTYVKFNSTTRNVEIYADGSLVARAKP